MKPFKLSFLVLTGFLLVFICGCSKYETSVESVGIPDATAKDIEGNEYGTVTIGSQTWFSENLKTTKYNDGSKIEQVTGSNEWSSATSGAFCWYNNDAATYRTKYGALYNWFAAKNGKLCPAGWHVPTDAEWTVLGNFLNGSWVAGGKMKTTTGWKANHGSTNASGFSALPGGYRDLKIFLGAGTNGFWWSSSEYNTQTADFSKFAIGQTINYYGNRLTKSEYYREYGFSVRCVKD